MRNLSFIAIAVLGLMFSVTGFAASSSGQYDVKIDNNTNYLARLKRCFINGEKVKVPLNNNLDSIGSGGSATTKAPGNSAKDTYIYGYKFIDLKRHSHAGCVLAILQNGVIDKSMSFCSPLTFILTETNSGGTAEFDISQKP